MRTLQSGTGAFQKVGECLHRYSNGVYYGRIRIEGKEIKCSIQTTRSELARRKLADSRKKQRQIRPPAGKLTLDVLWDRYLQTVQLRNRKRLSRRRSSSVFLRDGFFSREIIRMSPVVARAQLSLV